MAMPFGRSLLLYTALIAAGAARAQMISPMLYEGPRISLQSHANRDRAAAPAENPAIEAPDPARFRFVPSPERRARNLARFVEKSRTADARAADSLAALFAQGDIIERMRPEMAKHGLGVDNVADAYTVWWINAWQASRGIDNDISNAAAAAVRRQVMQSMGSTAMIRAANDAIRQEMAESLLIQALLLSASVDQAKGRPDQMQTVRAAALQSGRGMGVDLATMTLTEQGFVPG